MKNLHVYIILILLFSPVLFDLVRLIYRIKIGEISPQKVRVYLGRILSFCFVLATVVLTLNHTNYLNYESPIPYREIDRISFKNFRGFEFFMKELNGNERFAYVVTTIEWDVNPEEAYVEAFFHPSRSFVFNRDSYSTELLKHELYHFKITELFARKIREEISDLKEFEEWTIRAIVERYEVEERLYQKRYDKDTYHSFILKEQKKYERQVDSLINSLQKFQYPTIIK